LREKNILLFLPINYKLNNINYLKLKLAIVHLLLGFLSRIIFSSEE
jgi:hypothetical protein